jgi:Rrf2 family protein
VDAPPETLPAVASLLVHGAADQIAPLAPVQELARGAEGATLAIVDGGLHDVLNDQFHRSIAARLVTFLERVVKGAVVWDDTARPTVAPATRGVGRRAGLLHVSARLDYALRAVAALPSDPAAEPVRCETVARSKGIPLNSLVNLMIDLRRAGLVRSRRGCEGGYWLARPAAEITVADVARAVEGVIAPVPDEPIWSELGRAVTDFLENRNLESSP